MKSSSASLRARIIASYIAFSILLTLILGYSLLSTLDEAEDDLFNWYLNHHGSQHIDHFIRTNRQSENDEGLVIAGDFTDVVQVLPDIFTTEEELTNFSESEIFKHSSSYPSSTEQPNLIHELSSNIQAVHILERRINNKRYFYIVDVSEYDSNSLLDSDRPLELLIILFIIFLVLAFVFGSSIATRVVSPLTRLANDINNLKDNSLKDNNLKDNNSQLKRNKYTDDEVGFLADVFNGFLRRISLMLEREKEFSRYASHELRTPLASSRAALQLVQSSDNQELTNRALQRIDRANQDMLNLVDTFLMLGREEIQSFAPDDINIKQMLDSLVEKNSHLIGDKPISLITQTDTEHLQAPAALLEIVINNLMRNAIQNTQLGGISCRYQQGKIIICDSGSGFDADVLNQDSRGMGLKIIHRICDSTGWQVFFSAHEGGGTLAILDLNHSSEV